MVQPKRLKDHQRLIDVHGHETREQPTIEGHEPQGRVEEGRVNVPAEEHGRRNEMVLVDRPRGPRPPSVQQDAPSGRARESRLQDVLGHQDVHVSPDACCIDSPVRQDRDAVPEGRVHEVPVGEQGLQQPRQRSQRQLEHLLVRGVPTEDSTAVRNCAFAFTVIHMRVCLVVVRACFGDVGANKQVAKQQNHRHHVAYDQSLGPDRHVQLSVTSQASNGKAADEHELR
mmetsp:Transcript_101285/g.315058  ORF Transcript_101285/g.315058 Transcript_101285/m.315058 type:complete len:228 (+) Transcript_101285:376-1059(+)